MLCVASLEAAGYLWERNEAQGPLGWTLVASRRLHLERHGTEDQTYYKLTPNEDYVWQDIRVHIDSHGFRSDEFAVPKPAKTIRILNLGDSIAFGWSVREEQTYGALLKSSLNERHDSNSYEVINAAIPGWDPPDEQNFLLQEGLNYQPDVVILDLSIVNDIRGQGQVASMSNDQNVWGWLRDHTYGWPFLTTQARFLLARQTGPEAIPVLHPVDRAEAYYPLTEDDPLWDRAWSAILRMRDESKRRGIRFVILAFPTAFQLSRSAHPPVPQRVLGGRAAAAGIEFIDLLPAYRQACDAAGPDACEGYQNLLFADIWMHPSALGHRLAAAALDKL